MGYTFDIPMSISPKTVLKSTAPRLVPFIKTVVLYFALYPCDGPSSFTHCFFKCLPIITLIGFVLSHQRKTLQRVECAKRSSDDKANSVKMPKQLEVLPPPFKLPFILVETAQELWNDLDFMRLTTCAGHYSRFILIGLCMSCLGDAFLVFNTTDNFCFEFGIMSFGLAHINYCFAFGCRPLVWELGIIFWGLGSLSFILVFPYINYTILALASGAYSLVIATMLWRATVFGIYPLREPSSWNGLAALVGALTFAISDFCIALNKFLVPIPYYHTVCMVSYYLAQVFLALSTADGEGLRSLFGCSGGPPSGNDEKFPSCLSQSSLSSSSCEEKIPRKRRSSL